MEMLTLEMPGIRKVASGKVREIFDLGDHLLLVATDRISAFDCILPNPIPRKGEVLNLLSAFWCGHITFVPNHVLATNVEQFPESLRPFRPQLSRRSMLVLKAKPLPMECVVRGYLAGSGWKEYRETGSICGIALPPRLQQAERLPEALFTPSTKAASGHDQNISWDECRRLVGDDIAEQVRSVSIRIYEEAHGYAAKRGIIVADTKFEFGLREGQLILIDECLTPDSSRFGPPTSTDRPKPAQFRQTIVRDYLETLDWNKTPPAPALPAEVIRKTSEKYLEALARLAGPGAT